MAEIKYILKAVNSKADSSGNRYWAFKFTVCETGQEIKGYISGGESNIYGIKRHWNLVNDWDESIYFKREELKIREFDKLYKKIEYAGCLSEDIAAFIRSRIEVN